MTASNDNAGKTIGLFRANASVLQFLHTDLERRSWTLFGYTVGNEKISVIAAQPHPVASILSSKTTRALPKPAVKPIPFTIVK